MQIPTAAIKLGNDGKTNINGNGEIIMKRKTILQQKGIYAALASVMLLCSACGTQNNSPDNNSAANENTQENSGTANATDTTNQTDTTTAENNTADGTEGSANADTPSTESSEESVQISITFQTEENNEIAEDEDNTPIYTSVISYPVVSIEGNDAAAEKINADIQERVDSFQADTMLLDMAKEGYEYFLTEDNDYPFLGYSSDLSFTVTRSDSNVISFVLTNYEFSGGAHGNYVSVGINYDTRTGELINFANLGENSETFHDATFTFIQELAATEFYQGQMYPENTPEDLETVLYADEKWHFSTSGLVFIADPYALGPYAAGAIEFTIPYSDLEEMGLKEEYQYTENLMVKLADGETYTIDMNGDGTDDTIYFSTVYEENADGTSDFAAHLVINDVDVTEGYNNELSQLLSDNPWAECTLYDMDASDDTIEIVLSTTQTDDEAGNGTYTFSSFFRYEKDGSISYLGMTRGAVTDPTSDAYHLIF